MNAGFGGGLSQGKTISGLALAIDWSNNHEKKIISNCKLYGLPNTEYIPTKDLIDFLFNNMDNTKALEEKLNNSVLFIDEARTILSARKSTSNLNEVVTTVMMNLGKIDCDVILTFQLYGSQIDKQARAVMDLNFECVKFRKDGKPFTFKQRRQRIPKYDDGSLIPTIIKVYVCIEVSDGVLQRTERFIGIEPLEYAKYFDTRQMITLDREPYKTKK